MSLREEQCKKVCRILDDVLANRPTERDSLIVAVQLAFKALSEPHWIPVEQDLPKENYLDDGYVEPSQPVLVYMSYHTCKISRYWGHRKSKGTSDYVIPDWMDLEEYDGDNVIAWRELPEPYKGDTE